MHVFEFVVLEKVLEETVIILLVFIVMIINPAQVPQWDDVISVVGVFPAVQVSQINARVNVRDFNTDCR